jgi:hypothetical protein
MKKSETLKAELEQLEHEQDAMVKAVVFYEGHKPEEQEDDWNKYWNKYGRNYSQTKKQLENDIHKEENREIEVGDGATICLYSDRHASTVIKRTKATITVQHDKAILEPNYKPEWIPGGFSAHCTNQEEQSYTYERNPDGSIETFRWSEKNGKFQGGSDGSIKVILGRHEHYDYNF